MDDTAPSPSRPGLQRWLALDTSASMLSVAVGAAGAAEPLAWYEGAGGAHASATLLPTVMGLLQRVGWRLAELDGIVFGHGPGSFTGLRTACAVVQGLAAGARPGGVPVLPLGTLLAVAEAARVRHAPTAAQLTVHAALDARMDEVYVARYAWGAAQGWRELESPHLRRPQDLPHADGALHAGNVAGVYGERLPAVWRTEIGGATLPCARALLRLAAAGVAAGWCVGAAGAQPLYVRDQVALSPDEQAARRPRRTGG
ncbi:MAG: tRNA (adenosine(37)-N6)-threonylcarbamoyltransferase complex dimerization subunit type 1 TsaB [Tepidimonas sp.]|uniref:tRNA (adenosine(37)-N6)-threonylcarbamoyltransferase complex dimerization subunit type 1 TsaB n=1 Tax=Tepidimonas sp. TaxID=2002775 RepID=UPI00259EB34D|nr:tRNA (adenosine(37)-N6)-threonylcarbamoyltransferase complex dimerization subunit type 1 TsaB [Tepidimonas sp.]MDM7456923.1 tRNA (adenosine(37)-N6)-threonylcarbamoyltransferase complex dimerization subunit type 1 TsaB [Tepidimonas sp.]